MQTTLLLAVIVLASCAVAQPARPPLAPVVEAEEEVFTYTPADNGSDPMWCWSSTCLVRSGDELFASGLETIPNVKPLNNVRWTLYRRTPSGWKLVQTDPKDRTREPCPLAAFPDGRLLMSVNPTLLTDPQQQGGGPARPEILQFNASDPSAPFTTTLPQWSGKPVFCEHSYRTFTADALTGDCLLLNNLGNDGSHWALVDRAGATVRSGYLFWPDLAPGDVEPYGAVHCRANYPTVALQGRAVHFCGAAAFDNWDRVKDPVAHKERMGRQWGNRWRRLYYTWTPDLSKQDFAPWIEVSNTMATGGWLFPGDLYVAPDGTVHILWFEAPIDLRLRDKYFPDIKTRLHSIMYAQVRDGRVLLKKPLLQGQLGSPDIPQGRPRFQVTPDGRLIVCYSLLNIAADGKRTYDNWVSELAADGTLGTPVKLPLQYPLSGFFTTTPRGGSQPSDTLELLGPRVGSQYAIHYARIRLYPSEKQ